MVNLSKYIEEIYEHFDSEYPREGCGILGVVKGDLRWFPCKNVADTDDNFILDSKQYLEIKRKADIVAIVHSHPDAEATPSDYDIKMCNATGIPYYIFSFPDMKSAHILPEYIEKPLSGREYEFGVSDCFEAARDYYKSIGIQLPHRDLYEDDWWLKGLDYFTEEYIKTWGFKKVEEPEENDLLIFSVNSSVGNHCGVFMGNDLFFHHAEKRLSCRENLYPFWIKYLTGIYRYEA